MATLSLASANPGSFNLTTLGTRDWMRWNGSTFSRKASVVAYLNDFCETGDANLHAAAQTATAGGSTTVTFSDGDSPATDAGSNSYIKNAFGKGGGYVWCFYADTSTRTVTIMLNGASASMRARAYLSDDSAAATTITASPGVSATITVTFASATAGEVCTLVLSNDNLTPQDLMVYAIWATGTAGVQSGAPTNAPAVVNPSFESATAGNWTISGGLGIGTNGDAYTRSSTDGSKFALMHKIDGASAGLATQTITFAAGRHIVGFKIVESTLSNSQTMGISLSGSGTIGTGFKHDFASFFKSACDAVTVTAGSHDLSFTAEVILPGYDFIELDAVNILKLPVGVAPPPPGPPPPPPPPATPTVVTVTGVSASAANQSNLIAAVFTKTAQNSVLAVKFTTGRTGDTGSTTKATTGAVSNGACTLTVPIPGGVTGLAIGDPLLVYAETDPESTGSKIPITLGTVA